MTPIKHHDGGLVDQNYALDNYFEALLSEQLSSDYVPDPLDTAGPVSGCGPFTPGQPAQASLAHEAPVREEQSREAVIFTVDGLRLALPVENLAGIVDFPSEIFPATRSLPWYVGRFAFGESSIDIVDPAEIVIPSSHRVRSSEVRRRDMRHLLILNGTSWALACQEVESVTLDGGQIRWRTVHTRRRWLAGTVMSHACGLLDVDGLLAHLAPA